MPSPMRWIWLLCVAIAAAHAPAQDVIPAPAPAGEPAQADARADRAPPPVSNLYGSPRATMKTFLDAMNRAEQARPEEREFPLRAAASCLDLPLLAVSAGPSRAAMLKVVIDKIGYVWMTDLPDSEDVRANTLQSYTYFPNPDNARHQEVVEQIGDDLAIVLRRQPNGEWKFSRQTVDDITGLYVRTRDLGGGYRLNTTLRTREMAFRSYIPGPLQAGRVLTVEYWQIIGLVAILFVGLVVDYLVRFVLAAVWRRYAGREDTDREMLKKAVRPFGLLVAALLWYWAAPLLYLPPTAMQIVLIAARVFASFAAVFAAFRLADLLTVYFMRHAAKTDTRLDDLLIPLARRAIKIAVVILAIIYVAESFDVEIVPLLTGLGIGGLAFAFAAKDTIENFFGSIAVIADRPFVVGDWVVIDDVEGTVEELGLRSTRIRTFYNSLVTVPNSTLVRAKVDNYGRRRFRRYKTHVNLTYGTPPDKIEAFCEGVRELIRHHPYTRKDYYHVWLNSFGAHSLDVLIYMFHECPDWSTELRERHRFILDVMRVADRLDIEFAFPTQTLHVFQEEHGAEHTPRPAPGKDDELTERTAGRDAARAIMQAQHWRSKRPPPVRFDGKPDFGSADDDGG